MLAGLDIGGSGSKIVVYDEKGNLIEKFYKDYKNNRQNKSIKHIYFIVNITVEKRKKMDYNIDIKI